MYKATAGAPAGAAAGAQDAGASGQAKGGDDVIDAEYKPSN
jgi:hypothetical protein